MLALYAQASNTFITSQTYQKRSGDVILVYNDRYCSVYKLQDRTRIDMLQPQCCVAQLKWESNRRRSA